MSDLKRSAKMIIAIRIIIAVVILGAMTVAARLLDKRWRMSHPEEKPFAWGYFQALFFFPAGLCWFITPFLSDPASWKLWLCVTIYGFAGSYAGYALITKKRRWAWIFVVIAQLNLVTWLIDVHYGGNRWKEFR